VCVCDSQQTSSVDESAWRSPVPGVQCVPLSCPSVARRWHTFLSVGTGTAHPQLAHLRPAAPQQTAQTAARHPSSVRSSPAVHIHVSVARIHCEARARRTSTSTSRTLASARVKHRCIYLAGRIALVAGRAHECIATLHLWCEEETRVRQCKLLLWRLRCDVCQPAHGRALKRVLRKLPAVP
jgi:hypothetical protein